MGRIGAAGLRAVLWWSSEVLGGRYLLLWGYVRPTVDVRL